MTAANIEAALGYVPVTPSALAAKQNTLTDADRQSITKTGMTTGAAWTDAEQKAARERMGVDVVEAMAETIAKEPTAQQILAVMQQELTLLNQIVENGMGAAAA